MRAPSPKLVVAALIAALLTSCNEPVPDNGRLVIKSDLEKPNAAALLRGLGMPTPPATVEFYEYLPGRDDMAMTVFVVGQADWARMRAAPPLRGIPDERWSNDQAASFLADRGGWRPHQDLAIIAAQTWLPKAEFLQIGYSPAGPGRVRVYLAWGQT